MGTEHLPVEELQRLLSNVAEHGTQHLLEIEADLQQTAYLLSQAIDKLGSGFLRIHQSIAAQQQMMDAVLEKRMGTADDAADLLVQREQIAEEIDAVVTGLQFQDLTSQLIGRTLKRVDGLREVLAGLTQHDHSISAQSEHAAMLQLLQKMNLSLSRQSSALQDGLRQEVSQQHMESGEIELF